MPRNRLAKKFVVNSNMSVKKAAQVFNEAVTLYGHALRGRLAGVTGTNPDPRRDIDRECGYNADPRIEDFRELYDRFGLAARVVNLLPDECHSVDPIIYETERPRDTAFEKGVKMLNAHPDLNLNYYWRKVDALSGIGDYGGLFYGVNDGKPLDTIAEGLTEDGRMTPTRPQGRELLYIRALDESLLRIKTVNQNPGSRRFNMPQMYEVLFESKDGDRTKLEMRNVHWSRIQHVAECREGASEIRSVSRLRKVMDELWNIRKILGGSAEMFWKGGFPGIAATVDPRFIEAGGVDIDEESVSEELQKFMEGLQRYILGVGFQVNSLSPQVADPTAHLMMQFNVIAMSLGIPLRIFMGSEEAKLASGQDAKAWNKRVRLRQNTYLTPKLIRPLIFRLIATGVIPPTKQVDAFGMPVFNVWWPDVAQPDDNEKSTIADRRAAAMMKFVMSKSYQMMQPSDFLRFVLGYDPMEIDAIMENAKKAPEIVWMEDEIAKEESEANIAATKDQAAAAKVAAGQKAKKGPADSGSKGSPPSDTRTDAIK